MFTPVEYLCLVVSLRAGLSHQIPGELVQFVDINSISWRCRQNNGSLNVHTQILETWVILPHMAKRTWQTGLRFCTLILRDHPRLSCWTSLITQVLKSRGSSGLQSMSQLWTIEESGVSFSFNLLWSSVYKYPEVSAHLNFYLSWKIYISQWGHGEVGKY